VPNWVTSGWKSTDTPAARLKGPVPAAGWIKDLQVRDDGIWGQVEWTGRAAAMLAAKEYRFISPSIRFDAAIREIMRITGAGLVHKPNLFLTALASQDPTMAPPAATPPTAVPKVTNPADLATGLAELLHLPADTPPMELMRRLVEALTAKPDPAKYVPVAAVQEMLAERHEERRDQQESRITAKIAAAARDGFITNGMKSWATDLCRANEPAFDDFMKSAGATFAHLGKPTSRLAGPPPAASTAADHSDAATSIAAQLGLAPGRLKL
jgi:phage I-like protein